MNDRKIGPWTSEGLARLLKEAEWTPEELARLLKEAEWTPEELARLLKEAEWTPEELARLLKEIELAPEDGFGIGKTSAAQRIMQRIAEKNRTGGGVLQSDHDSVEAGRFDQASLGGIRKVAALIGLPAGAVPTSPLPREVRNLEAAISRERERREQLWSALCKAGGPLGVAPSLIKQLGIQLGQQGVFRDIATTAELTESRAGVALSVRHTGSAYADDLGDDDMLYHYPTTSRGAGGMLTRSRP